MDEGSRDLGGLGQTEFENLCSNYAGAIANKATNDRRGWDYFVEFSYPSHKLPLDMRPAPAVAVVQVKATEGEPVIRVKLSNAMRFASRLDPCFYILFVYDHNSRTPKAVYVRHVWDELIEHAILRSRELEADERTDHHNATVTIRFKDEHRIDNAEVVSVLHRIASEKGTEYAKEKTRRFYFSGVAEDGLGKFGLAFPEDVTEDDLVDLSLGLRESVPCNGTVAYSERFGIRLRAPMLDIGPGHLSIDTSKPTNATIVFSGSPDGDIACSVGVLAPQFPLRDECKRRVRVRGTFLDLVLRLHDLEASDISLVLDADQRASLDELEQYLRLICEVTGKETAFQLWIDTKPALWGKLRLPEAPKEARAWQSILSFVQVVQRHMLTAKIPEGFSFSLNEIIDDCEAIHAFLQLTLLDQIMVGAPRHENRLIGGGRTNVFYSVAVRIGQYAVCAQMIRLGEVISSGNEGTTLTLREPKVLAVFSFAGTIEQTELKRILDLDMWSRCDVTGSPFQDVEDVVLLDGPFSFEPSQPANAAGEDDPSSRLSRALRC